MSFTHFTTEQVIPLILSGAILISSIITFKKNSRISLCLLFIGSLGLGCFIANLDHFLILWDEQYHALVAKNLSKDFLKPMLYTNPALDFDYRNWTENHIWLHKQPFFLWQIALSIKLFGTTEFGVRLPSIIMHAIIPVLTYRIGKISINKETGYYGALLFAIAYFPLELVAGRYSTDHNDMAFLFYITASFWAWFEYSQSQKKYWLLIIGFFSGAAVLTKWLMGLLVFVVWTFTTFMSDFQNGIKPKSYIPIISSGIVSLIIFLPWQVYIHSCFPQEAEYEAKLSFRHLFEPIENHSESTWYYFTDGLKIIYGSGDIIPFLLLLGVLLFVVNIREKKYKAFVIIGILFVFSFYTLASTKMVSFTIIVSPLIYLSLGYLTYRIFSIIKLKIKNNKLSQTISTILLISISFTALNLTKIQNYHTYWKPYDNHNRIGEQVEMNFIKQLDTKLDAKNYVIFNASITVNGHIPIMFYTDYLAYNFIPSQSQIEKIRNENKKIAVINWGTIPDYILKDKRIVMLEIEYKELIETKTIDTQLLKEFYKTFSMDNRAFKVFTPSMQQESHTRKNTV